MFANLSPCKGKSFKEPDDYKAFALTGRIADCHYPQGDALGLELLPFQGVYAYEWGVYAYEWSVYAYEWGVLSGHKKVVES